MNNEENNTTTVTTSQQNYAGFGTRFLAYWVDFVILFPLGLVLQSLFGNNVFAVFQAQTLADLQKVQSSPNFLINMVVAMGLGLAYWLIFWVNYDGATPGKKLLGIKITRDNGDKLTYPSAFIRYIGFLVSSFTTLFFGLGFLWIIWDKKKQALHDKIAGTVVIKTGQKPKTALAVLLMLLAIFMFFGYMTATIIKGFSLGFQAAQQAQQKASDPNAYAKAIFDEANKYRAAQNLPAITEEQNVCMYINKRIDELESKKALTRNNTNSDYDDHQGFMEDMNSPQIRNLYFANLDNQTEYYGHTNAVTEAAGMITSWVALNNSQLKDPNYTLGCARADKRYTVLILATPKKQVPAPTTKGNSANPTAPTYTPPALSPAAQQQLNDFQKQFNDAQKRIEQGQR